MFFMRVKGVVTGITMKEGVGKTSGKPWQIKVYTIEDEKDGDDKGVLQVGDFGRTDPNSGETPSFYFHSDHVKGEQVDIMCSVATNDLGFTNINYWKPYDELANPTKAAPTVDSVSAEAPVVTASADGNTDLPF